ncbi:ferric-chelate reductase [Saccharomycopsis crataegensis]|uniref:ferric-chelate reductase (NADPH) n=1 Tax=Saccharomycopsis crataegensis TaxID=43959 RepID=A0AAV5QT11_9ASCO|nr:ferric-chelate reductase [Saccharomycopsis crataegensis]
MKYAIIFLLINLWTLSSAVNVNPANLELNVGNDTDSLLVKRSTSKNTGHNYWGGTPQKTNLHRASPYLMITKICQTAASSFKFAGANAKGTVSCKYTPYAGTLAICLFEMSTSENEIRKAMPTFSNLCANMTYDKAAKIYANATKYAVNQSEVPKNGTINYPVTISSKAFQKASVKIVTAAKGLDRASSYGLGILYYWFGVMVISAIVNLFTATGLVKKFTHPIFKKAQRYLLIPSLLSEKHRQTFKFLGIFESYLPSRAESIIVSGYLILYIVFMSVHLDGTGVALNKLISDRAGIIASAHMPLLFLFGGRNNIMMYLTGFNHSTFIQFHKWTGRIMSLNVLIHGAGYARRYLAAGTYAANMKQEYVVWGIVAATSAGVIMFQSYNWFRKNTYEFFLITHIVLSVIFMVGALRHVYTFGWTEFFLAAIAVWVFDRLVRIIRLFNFGLQKANIKVISEDTFKVTVKRPHGFRWYAEPGQYVYLHFFTIKTFGQSHPFTVTDSNFKDGEINIYIKCKKGATKRIYDMVSKKPDQVDNTILVGIEGPYGPSAPNHHYDNIALFAGGNGIPGIFDGALRLARKYPEGQKNIRMIWAARDLASISWFLPELQLLRKETSVQVSIYLTRENPEKFVAKKQLSEANNSSTDEDNKSDEKTDSEKSETYAINSTGSPLVDQLDGFDVICGRPNIEELICDWFAHDSGSISITSCGPGILCDSLRKSISANIEKHKGRVDYYEDLQIW